MNMTAPIEQQSDALAGRSAPTYHLISDKARARATIRHRNMIKQRICGVILALCGAVPMMVDKNATTFIFLAMFYLPMIFGKQYIMTFRE